MTKHRGNRLNLKAILESADEIDKKDEDGQVDANGERKDETPEDDVANVDKLFNYTVGTESADEDEEKTEDADGNPDLANVNDAPVTTESDEDEEKKDESDDEEKKDEADGDDDQKDENGDIGAPGPLASTKVEDDDDVDLTILDDEDEEKSESEDDEEKKDEADGDDDQKDESDEEEKQTDEMLTRAIESLGVTAEQADAVRAILRTHVTESVTRLTKKAVRTARKLITEKANEKLKVIDARAQKFAERASREFVLRNQKAFVESSEYGAMSLVFKDIKAVLEKYSIDTNPDFKALRLKVEGQVAERNATIEKLQTKLETANIVIESHKVAVAMQKMTADMTDMDAERFQRIVQELDVSSAKEFVAKATQVKERLFAKNEENYDRLVESFETDSEKNLGVGGSKVVTEGKINLLDTAASILANG